MGTGSKSNQGYAEEADNLFIQYEAISFEESHAPELHLFPKKPSRILDIGAGTGRDAAYLADAGHEVIAVEPTRELREPAALLHPSPRITWVDDCLPDLSSVVNKHQSFDMILLTAVWMHLTKDEREKGMPVLGSLTKPGGLLFLTLRHGPVPPGRRMFDVSAEETISLAKNEGFNLVMDMETKAISATNKAQGITWSRLAFERQN